MTIPTACGAPDAVGRADEAAASAEEPAELDTASIPEAWVTIDPEYTLYIEVPRGRIVVALSQDLAQGHVAQLKTLARAGYFDGLQFYRVIEGFVAQGGDYSEAKPIPAENALPPEFDEPWSEDIDWVAFGEVDQFGEQAGFINGFPARRSIADNRVWITRCTGVMGLGRYDEPNTANAHFWIALQPIRRNDRNDTVFGRVVWGMEHVSTMTRTGAELGDETRWTLVESVRVASDVPIEERTALEMWDTNSAAFQAQLAERRNPTESWFLHRPRNFGICEAQVAVREAGATPAT